MKYRLKSFNTQLTVSRIAIFNYFEFVSKYHTIEDSHNFCELLYVDNGSLMINSDNYSGFVTGNQLIIHRPNEIHSLVCMGDIAPNVIVLGFECFSEELVPFAYSPVTLSPEHKKLLADVMQEGMNVYEPPYDMVKSDMSKRKNPVFGADQMLKNKLESFLITIIRDFKSREKALFNDGTDEADISGIYNYINEHYTERIKLDNLCFLFGTNKTTLCKTFKNVYGVTITDYINVLREKEAKRLLRENELSITQISERLGFNSIHYFCRFFKNASGQSPKEYSKTIRSKLEM